MGSRNESNSYCGCGSAAIGPAVLRCTTERERTHDVRRRHRRWGARRALSRLRTQTGRGRPGGAGTAAESQPSRQGARARRAGGAPARPSRPVRAEWRRESADAYTTFYFGAMPLPLHVLGPDNPMYFLRINQRDLERVLGERAAELGVEVRRGYEVSSLAQSEDHVDLVAVGPDGGPAELSARFVVGCDGGHSLVRKQAGIAFPGIVNGEVVSRTALIAPTAQFTRPAAEGPGTRSVSGYGLRGSARSTAPSIARNEESYRSGCSIRNTRSSTRSSGRSAPPVTPPAPALP